VQEWGFDDLVKANASRILFTNGLKDGWSVGGIQQNISERIIALNFENGAHHSDLSGQGPSNADTDDIKTGFASITHILGVWLNEVQPRSVVIKRE
jgi:lysosomal Pro-X carboxypeptidase